MESELTSNLEKVKDSCDLIELSDFVGEVDKKKTFKSAFGLESVLHGEKICVHTL